MSSSSWIFIIGKSKRGTRREGDIVIVGIDVERTGMALGQGGIGTY
jgi:hypothetical protein